MSDDDDDFYTYYSDYADDYDSDDDDDSNDGRGDEPGQTDSEPMSSSTITPTSCSSPTKRGKSLPLRIVKGTFTILGSVLVAALAIELIRNRNKK